jgi:hypothetical protein
MHGLCFRGSREDNAMMRMRFLTLSTLLLAATIFAADTQPAASLSGKIDSKAKITRVAAVDRSLADVLKTSAMNPKDQFLYDAAVNDKGEFHVDTLLARHSYDLIVWTVAADGAATRWEGVNMDYHRAIVPSTACTPDDRKEIEKLITDPPQFYDKVRPLKMAADHQHACVLVELIRTRDFHDDKGGEVIYRVELWYFENLFGGWAKDNNTEKVVVRARGKPADLPQNWQFLPQLGNLPAGEASTTAPASQPGEITLPEKPDVKFGILGGIK